MTKVVAVLLFAACAVAGWYLRGLRDEAQLASLESADVSAEKVSDSASHSEKLSRGAILFQLHCAKCHGAEGHGDTEAAARLRPPPRDFASRPWKTEISAASIERVTRDGIRGTGMPAAPFLSDEELSALAEHVLELSNHGEHASAAGEVCTTSIGLNEHSATPQWVELSSPLRARRFVDSAGNTLSLDELKGTPVIIHVWGTNCAACLREMPGLQKLAGKLAANKLRVVHVCADVETAAEAQPIIERIVPGTKTFVDASGLLSVNTLPTTFLLAADGRPTFQIVGAADWESQDTVARLERWLDR